MNTNHDLTINSRIAIAFASGMLVAVFFLPAWRIDLFAPQYPEGLMMNIWIDRLSGNVDIINGLNHYIGMKPFSNASFPEFKYLHYIVYFFIALGLLIALTGKKRLLQLYVILTILGGTIAMVDFYQWGYKYGHDLDPHAAIQVPGLSYQPPVFGHKRLLNFDAYSFPDVGGWVVIISGLLAVSILFYEWYRVKKSKSKLNPVTGMILGFLLAGLGSCTLKPEPLVSGKDSCSHCKMTIIDPKYGGEIITKKGKIYKFDDLVCMKQLLKTNTPSNEEIKLNLVSNFAMPEEFIRAEEATFYTDPSLKTPMGSNTCAFKSKEEALKFKEGKEGLLSSWKEFTL